MTTLFEQFEDYLAQNLPKCKTFHPHFEDALGDMLKAGGKRFRPMLLLNVVKSKNSLLLPNSMPVALGLEMLHTYSLIHDDLPSMDDASLRRGFKTLHEKYDEVTAILVGDALNTHAFNEISNAPLHNDIKIDLVKVLSENGGINGMIIGQAIDCHFENQKLEINQLEFLHIQKTAKLIATSLQMGAIIAQYEKKTQEELFDFGIDLGLLFQIQDDIIDETQSEQEAGKTTQNDDGKNSFVNLLGIDGAKKAADELALKCTNRLNNLEDILKNSLEELLLDYINRHK